MNSNIKTQKHKRPYRKPALRVVKLAAREVLATGCKVSGGFAGSLPMNQLCDSNTCFVAGS